MATLREIKRKIGAVKKTKQITRAMFMVAAAKLRSVQGKMENFRPYAGKFAEILGTLSKRMNAEVHPLLTPKEKVAKVTLIHLTSDRGLCGSFNMNAIHRAERWLKEQKAKGVQVDLVLIGKKGRDYFRKRGHTVQASHINAYGGINISFSDQIAKEAIDRYLKGETDAVYLLYAHFINMGKQEPTLVRLIPMEPVRQEETTEGIEYLVEPSAAELLVELLPKNISVQIMNALLEHETSEYAARMAAMDNATQNCSELIQNLTLVYNKARQATITAELMDIIGGAEALR
ncbi:MAG: ATP synthase F1 subunit gamma [Desulfobacteraceae bacterium]|nr:MAG: ATP synthase F1 subunit gamma [Desulfobacteraceae bacterium]